VRFDLDRRWGHADYAYEFYDYTTQSAEHVNQFADPDYADQVAALMAKLEQFDECKHIREGDPVTRMCTRITQK
jgi:hypothetical protein